MSGHNNILGSVFRELDQLKRGDAIDVYSGGTRYQYAVDEVLIFFFALVAAPHECFVPLLLAAHQHRPASAQMRQCNHRPHVQIAEHARVKPVTDFRQRIDHVFTRYTAVAEQGVDERVGECIDMAITEVLQHIENAASFGNAVVNRRGERGRRTHAATLPLD